MGMIISHNGYGGYEMSRGGDSRQIIRRADGIYEVCLDLNSAIPVFESKDLEDVIDYILDEN